MRSSRSRRPRTPAQTRFALVVALDKANPNQYLASLNRRVVPNDKDSRQYHAWLTLGPPDTVKRHNRVRPTDAKSGRLRLVREGAELAYLVADGDDDAFTLLAKFPLGPEDVKEVRIVGSTGGDKAAIDVRVRDLRIKAAALPRPAPKVVEELVAPKADYPQEHYHSFKGNPAMAAGWEFHGPGAAECVQFEREGLRVTLPAGREGVRPGVGLQTGFSVKGDFEITMSFEILKAPVPADLGKDGTRLSLAIVKDTPHKGTAHVEAATLSRSTSAKNATIFVTWMRRRNAADDADDTKSKIYPSTATSGRLRLVRSGAELFYLKAEGADDKFKVLTKFSFGAEDLQRVEIVGATGGDKASLDARITDIHIRAGAAQRPGNRSGAGGGGWRGSGKRRPGKARESPMAPDCVVDRRRDPRLDGDRCGSRVHSVEAPSRGSAIRCEPAGQDRSRFGVRCGSVCRLWQEAQGKAAMGRPEGQVPPVRQGGLDSGTHAPGGAMLAHFAGGPARRCARATASQRILP